VLDTLGVVDSSPMQADFVAGNIKGSRAIQRMGAFLHNRSYVPDLYPKN